MIAYKMRLYPNKEQKEKLEFTLTMCRNAYNEMLAELQEQTVIDRNMIQGMLPDMKIIDDRYKQIYSKTLQYECYRLFSNLSVLSALKKKRHKIGRLRFKGKDWFKTFNYNQSGFKLRRVFKKNGRLELSKIGDIKIKLHREVEGNIKQITVKKSVDKWYATIITDGERKLKCGNKELGIDLGTNNFIVDSENNKIEHPKILERHSKNLKDKQRKLSKKKKGSRNRKKARRNLARLHQKIKNYRDDFLHKVSTDYIKKSKLLVLEKLNIKKMMQQKYFNARNMADASWGRFVQFLTYKAESAGCKLVQINPKNTTKTCSKCGNIKEMKLWDRIYKCSNCDLEIDRDYNSAINILNIGTGRAIVEINPSTDYGCNQQGLSMKQEATSFREW